MPFPEAAGDRSGSEAGDVGPDQQVMSLAANRAQAASQNTAA